ncbi:Neurotransmitter-gated ion-channel ligand-binding domain [Trinorchestia longiramus]|nr:Neurotransmitter-gated ion-channel ligand-binding domain [Trinorchestia longiramus]
MNLELYPLDTQTCELLMASYGWTTEDLVFKWKKDDPVQVTVLHLPRFTLEDHKPGSCDSKTNTVHLRETVRRKVGYNHWQMLILKAVYSKAHPASFPTIGDICCKGGISGHCFSVLLA